MFSTPLICSSMGAITVVATTSALAPGYWPEMLMMGGAISGYCATGRRMKVTPPRMRMTIATTEAKIGRSMKKCEMRIALLLLLLLLRRARRARSAAPGRPFRHRGHLDPRPRAHDAVHDHPVVRREPFLDHAPVALQRPERDVFLLHHVVRPDHVDELAHLLGSDRRLRHGERLVRRRRRHAHAAEHARGEQPVGIGEQRAGADRARRLIDHVVDEIDGALVHEVVLV